MVLIIKKLVSKKKKRITEKVNKTTFDLDLSYIDQDIIAMGFPSTSFEKLYRNSRDVVKKYLDFKHVGSYKLWNLCAEKQYDMEKFENRVCNDFQFYDHESPPWRLIIPCCKSIQEYLNSPSSSEREESVQSIQNDDNKSDNKKVAVIHCKAGKGRTGVIISAFLVYDRRVKTSEEALHLYAVRRTKDMKGVTIPSQRRYVHYVGKWMELGGTEPNPRQTLILKKIKFPTPSTNMILSYKIMKQDKELVYRSNEKINTNTFSNNGFIEIGCEVTLRDDIKLIIQRKDTNLKKKLLQLWFNIDFIENNYAAFPKFELDKIQKDKKNIIFDADMKLELFFESPSRE